MDLELHLCQCEEMHIIENLAYKIWPQAYNRILSKEQISYMLKKMYSVESLATQHHTGTKFFLVKEGRDDIGFVSFTDRGKDYYINKFYLLPSKSGQSRGTCIYDMILEQLRPLKPVRLNVNRHNIRAINFYFKIGFRIESVEDIKIGAGFEMNDFIMHTNPERRIKKSYP